MKPHDPVDPRIDRLVAYLYDELAPEERREFEQLLESDADLRAEYDGLTGTRSLLGGWELDDHVPSFVVVDAAPARRRPAVPGFFGWLREHLGGVMTYGGWAVAGAAAVVMILTLRGVSLTGRPNQVAQSTHRSEPALVGPGAGFGPSNGTVDVGRGPGTPDGVQLTGGADPAYMTREEFDQYSAALLRMMASYLNDYRSRRDEELGAVLRSLYGQLNNQQSSQYADLLTRIDEAARAGGGRPLSLGWSRADSLGPARQRPDGVEVKRNE